ncbi:MAG: hypothetical protein ACE5GI_01400 [Candidatus Aminicenantales bacterium]
MTPHLIEKALEVWTLQNLLNFSIMLGMLALGLAIVQKYYLSIAKFLTLRVSLELWNALTILLIDILLVVIMIVGYLVLNPDIMADIKMAVPFVPVAVILFTIALFLRLFHGGHQQQSPNFIRSIWLMFGANIINIIGFSLIMKAPSGEYLETHPSLFWTFIKTHLRSNANPHGLELSQITFYVCFPILMIVLI